MRPSLCGATLMLLLATGPCGHEGSENTMNDHEKAISKVRNDLVRFATQRPPGARSATLERRVTISDPPELVHLAQDAKLPDLEALIALLDVPDRSWAAEVMLAALTRREEKLVDAFQATPERWWTDLGATARGRWTTWFEATRHRLVWNEANGMFVEQP